jgi:hypothetical protein
LPTNSWNWRVPSSAIQHRMTRLKPTDVKGAYFASIFRVEEWAKQETSLKQVTNTASIFY